jgi:hypothetical protein
MPRPDDERDAGPLGSEVAPPGNEASQGGPTDDKGSGVAGPSYPPADSEPDAR